MRKGLALEIYALLVCCISIIVCASTVGLGLYDIVRIQSPSSTLWPDVYRKHTNNLSFVQSFSSEAGERVRERSQAEITVLREQSYQVELRSAQREGAQGLIRKIITLLVMSLLFALHWRIAGRVRE